MRLRILSAEDVRGAVTMPAAIEAMRSAFSQLSGGDARVPLRIALPARDGITLVMPARLEESGDLATKVVSVFGGNAARGLPAVTGVVLLLAADTGLPLAVLEGAAVTALRTGAASGLATSLLARDDAAVLAVFGAGAQARTQIDAVRAVRAIREVRVLSRTGASAARLADELEGVDARAWSDPREAVRGAHVIVAATDSRAPVFPGDAVEPGAHVNGIGSYTPEMREVDVELVARARLVVDSRESALAEAGDLIHPLRQGRIREADLTELGEVVRGERPGRSSPEEVTFFKSVGSAAQDAALAGAAVRAAERDDLGTVVEL